MGTNEKQINRSIGVNMDRLLQFVLLELEQIKSLEEGTDAINKLLEDEELSQDEYDTLLEMLQITFNYDARI